MGRTRGSRLRLASSQNLTIDVWHYGAHEPYETYHTRRHLDSRRYCAEPLFVSTDGNGQNPLPVVAQMGLVVLVVGVVSFALASFVRTVPLAVLGSAAITELLFLLYFVCRVAFSEHLHPHVSEELYLLPIVFVVFTAPTVMLSSIGFGRLASRVYRRRRAEPNAAPNGGPATQHGNSGVTEVPPSVS